MGREGGEVALRESEAGYRELFEGNPTPMWVCHRETQGFLAVNEAALRLYGYSRSQFLGLSLSGLGGEEPESASQAGQDQVTNCRQLRKDGSPVEVQLTWHPCEFQGARAHLVVVWGAASAGQDHQREVVLEHQVAERACQLEAAHRELETFSYSVSHDLQAPLRHIDGFSRALLDDYGEVLDPQAQEYLSRICQAAEKMSQLIDAMQQLARVGRAELSRQSVDLNVKAQVIALELKHREPQRKVEFVIEEDVKVDADPKLVRQLLEILIGNAWKFTSRTESVLIRFGAVDKEGKAAYFVSDNGAGFDMAYADKLFSAFHRLHRADEFEGSGVGLAIAQRIVARHGGKIWAESAPGRGATFYFTLG